MYKKQIVISLSELNEAFYWKQQTTGLLELENKNQFYRKISVLCLEDFGHQSQFVHRLHEQSKYTYYIAPPYM